MEPSPVSVLIIDPDSASRNYLAAMLGKSGYTVLSTGAGKEGLIMAWRDKPGIIVLDPALPDLKGLELVLRLRQDRRTSHVPLVALSSQENSKEMSALLAAGCSEYLVKSSQALQKLLDLFPRLLHGEKAPEQKKGKLIVFLSAKGGTGTSSLCANIATCVAGSQENKPVAVMDLVLPIGSIAQIVGYDEKMNLVTAALKPPSETTPDFFRKSLPRVSGWMFHLLAGAPDPQSSNQLVGDRVGEMLGSVLAAYDYVFVDLGRSLSHIALPIIQKADVIALILSTDRATADLTLTVWNHLKSQGIDSNKVYAIQNRAVGLEGLTKAELEKMLGMPIRVTMPYIGDNMTVANNRHESLAARFQNDSAAMLMKQVAGQMIEMVEKRPASR
ncbi:MAG TPA: response regulator [Anaerolineales bacterium]|nr:response regulator [Anaerolineales bacterium]